MESNQESSIIPAISSSSTRIFEDLIPDILKWLPVKSLCRFRCVCESWYELISSSSFIELHYTTTSSATPPHLKSYLRRKQEYDICYDEYALCRPQDDHIRRPLFFPFRFHPASNKNVNDLNFVDLIHGVVCLSYWSESEERLDDTVILWNPATHSYMVSSTAEAVLNEFRYFNSMGFGYDTCTDDFIVVRIWFHAYSELCGSLSYQVYSAQQDLWIEKFDDDIQFCRTATYKGRFVNGSIHWLVTKYGDMGGVFVIAFDCELQEFTTMELPRPILRDDDSPYAELLDYCGMLSVLGYSDDDLELWVMEERGLDTTWKKLYVFSRDTELNAVDIYQSSYLKMAPYGPNEWIKFRWNGHLFGDILNHYVYDESIMLMDLVLVQEGYKNKEIVHVDPKVSSLSTSFQEIEASEVIHTIIS